MIATLGASTTAVEAEDPESTTPAGGYVDRADDCGLSFEHQNGRSGRKILLETLGAGVAILDADDDGHPDIYCVNGAALPGRSYTPAPRNALFRNRGDGHFEDRSETSGTADPGYGFGVSVADFDGDGRLDIHVTNFGENRLLRNLGDLRFEDVTSRAGVAGSAWSTGSAFLDFDGDGDLDLYVANYVEYDLSASEHGCRRGNIVAYCHPRRYRPTRDTLYRNDGDGRFSDVTVESGLGALRGNGLGVICGDHDNDGDIDIFVANDKTPNFLLVNRGNGRFEEQGFLAGIACGEDGREESSMGVALDDYDHDGWLDFAVTNFTREPNSLYRNEGGEFFSDQSYASGAGRIAFSRMGWGTKFFDFDLDGRRDWFVANGDLQTNLDKFEPTLRREQRHTLLRGVGKGIFEDTGDAGGPALEVPGVGRGAAFGDLDSDGDIDIVLSNEDAPLRYLRCDRTVSGHWLLVDLRQKGPNPFAIGARVRIEHPGEILVDEVRSGGSYLSHNDLRLHFGLGKSERIPRITVRWPDGASESREDVPVDRVLRWQRSAP